MITPPSISTLGGRAAPAGPTSRPAAPAPSPPPPGAPHARRARGDVVELSPEAIARADEAAASDPHAHEGKASDDAHAPTDAGTGAGEPLTEEERQTVDELTKRDREVRAHEQAHKAAGGSLTGAIGYEYQRGPDGKRYAVGGEVPIDASPVEGDPEATIAKMQRVRRAALAPAQPSAADRQVAAKATRLEREARAEAKAPRTDDQPDDGTPATPSADHPPTPPTPAT